MALSSCYSDPSKAFLISPLTFFYNCIITLLFFVFRLWPLITICKKRTSFPHYDTNSPVPLFFFFPFSIYSYSPSPFFSLLLSILLSQFLFAWQRLIKFTGVKSFDDGSSSAFSIQIVWHFCFRFVLHFHWIQSLVNFSHCFYGTLCFSCPF